MADVFDFYVKDNRTIQFDLTEPIMLEDSHVSDWVFHIPRVLNNIDMSGWAWWLVYINARGQKYSELLELSEDPESPLEKCIATYSVDYGMSIKAGTVRFSLEAINTDTGGEILNEWHTQTYQAKVQDTLQGNQVEFAETESDIISALIIEVQNKVAQLVGGATPLPVDLKSLMTDHDKVYLYTGSEPNESTGYWYYYNGTQFSPGGQYGAGVIDSAPTQGSANAVQSGGVYEALFVDDTSNWHFTGGYINGNKDLTGGQSVTTKEEVSELIPVRYGFKYKFTMSHSESISDSMWIAFQEYDEAYLPVGSRTSKTSSASEYTAEYTIVNQSARYFRVCYRTYDGLVLLKAYRSIKNDTLLQNEKIDLSTDGFRHFFEPNFTVGSALIASDNVTVNILNTKYRVCSKGWMRFNKPCIIEAPSGFQMYTYYRFPGETTVTGSGWGRRYAVNTPNTDIWITIKRTEEDSSEVLSDVNEFVSGIKCSDDLKTIGDDLFGFYDNLTTIPELLGIKQYNRFLTLPGTTGYIDYNTVAETITIPRDTVIIGYKAQSNGSQNKIINSSQDVVFTNVNIATYGTSLIKLSIVPETGVFTLKGYNYKQDEGEYIVAIIRLKSSSYVPVMASLSPWSINGNPYNIPPGTSPEAFIKSINHRGYNSVAPENTLPAFKLSRKKGFEYVETDVRHTSDGVPVLLHDESINRTARNADGTELSSTVNISDITYAQALEYDFGIAKGDNYAGTRIPTFAEFCSLCKKLGLHPYVELKDDCRSQARIDNLVSILHQNGLKGKYTFISFDYECLTYAKNSDPEARLGMLCGAIAEVYITNAQALKTATNETFVDCALGEATAEGVASCISAGIPLEVYGGVESSILPMNDYITGATTDRVVAGRVIYDYNIEG